MPLNLLKKYPGLLEIAHLREQDRKASLRGVFDRDISNNENFRFRERQIYPTKKEGEDPLDILFTHLTTTKEIDENNRETGLRIFEYDRSIRLHWIRTHIEEKFPEKIEIFSINERVNRADQIRTYVFDKDEKYVIVLEPQRDGQSYYLLTAYYLNKSFGIKQMRKKYKRRLSRVH